jgi:hypothetical protein
VKLKMARVTRSQTKALKEQLPEKKNDLFPNFSYITFPSKEIFEYLQRLSVSEAIFLTYKGTSDMRTIQITPFSQYETFSDIPPRLFQIERIPREKPLI